jgi:DNA polymerase-3 subunit epsilon
LAALVPDVWHARSATLLSRSGPILVAMERLYPSAGYAVVDVETTGFDPLRDRVVEVAIVHTDGEQIRSRWSSLVDPGIPIPEGAEATHGISDADVRGAPELWALLPAIEDLVEGRTIVAHHARFDRNFLWMLRRPWLCTLELARRAYPHAPSHGLGGLVDYLGLRPRLGTAPLHRALPDAEATAHVLAACLQRLKAA